MVARTDQDWKARLYDLEGEVRELVREGKRDPRWWTEVLQLVKDNKDFHVRLGLTKLGGAEEQVARWEGRYREVYGVAADFKNLALPERRPGFDRLILVHEAITSNKVFAKLSERMPTWRYADDFDPVDARSVRKPGKTYAIWVRERDEADEEHKGKSANDLERDKVNTETLLERLLQEDIFESETGKHLDLKNITLCAGSRDPGGGVPDVCWDADRLHVDWSDAALQSDILRARAVVS